MTLLYINSNIELLINITIVLLRQFSNIFKQEKINTYKGTSKGEYIC